MLADGGPDRLVLRYARKMGEQLGNESNVNGLLGRMSATVAALVITGSMTWAPRNCSGVPRLVRFPSITARSRRPSLPYLLLMAPWGSSLIACAIAGARTSDKALLITSVGLHWRSNCR